MYWWYTHWKSCTFSKFSVKVEGRSSILSVLKDSVLISRDKAMLYSVIKMLCALSFVIRSIPYYVLWSGWFCVQSCIYFVCRAHWCLHILFVNACVQYDCSRCRECGDCVLVVLTLVCKSLLHTSSERWYVAMPVLNSVDQTRIYEWKKIWTEKGSRIILHLEMWMWSLLFEIEELLLMLCVVI